MSNQRTSRSVRPKTWSRCALRLVLLGMVSVLASGCGLSQWAHNHFKVGPNYDGTPAQITDVWIDGEDARVISSPPAHSGWWTTLQDPVINDLVRMAAEQNLTLRQAGTRVLQARAARQIAKGNLFPQSQQISGAYSREQISTVDQPYLLPIPGLFSRSFDAWSLAGDLNWELDVWGRFRRAVESADASLDASVHEYDAVLICLIAEVATAYVDIRTFQQRLQYARDNVRIQEGSLELSQVRAREGKTNDISVHLAKSNLDATRATIPQLEVGLRQANNRLCTLLGLPVIELDDLVGDGDGIPTAPAEIAVGIPADLLRRRPDVLGAERKVAAQSAQIGVAMADLYPSISVAGKITVGAEEFSDMFSSLSQGGSVGPSFEWNVLNYGRIRNNVRVQESRLDELIANYQNTVLSANQEVENALVAFLRTQRQAELLASTVKETQSALKLVLIRFKEGESDFTGVFVLQADVAIKQDQLAAAQGQIVASLIQVYKALGGGWEAGLPGLDAHEIVDVDGVEEQIPVPPIPSEE